MNTHPYFRDLRTGALTLFFALFWIAAGSARPVRIPSPEELFEMSDAVVNGKVLDVTLTSERGELNLGYNKPIPIRIAEARIATMATNKGSVSGNFTLRFPVMDPDIQQVYVNGPMLPYPQKDERYRFYLKQKDSNFVTVLHEEFDSGFAVHRLAQDERDDSPPLFEKEAQAVASNFFREYRLKPSIAALDGHFNGSGWTFTYFTGPPLSFPSFSADAEVTVDGSRTINRKSWVGREAARKGAEFTNSDLGASVRLTIQGQFMKGVFQPEPSTITILYGTIDSVKGTTVSGRFESPAFEPGSKVQKISFPRESIASVQRLAVTPYLQK